MSEFESSTMDELVGRLRSRQAKYNAFWPELPLDQMLLLRGGLALRLLANVLHTYVRAVGLDDYTLVVIGEGASPFSLSIKDGGAEVVAGDKDGADRLTGPPDVLVLLFYGQIGLAEALASGARIIGDADRVGALLGRPKKP